VAPSTHTGRFVVRLTDDIALKIAERAQVLALADLESLQELADTLDGLDALKKFFTRYPKHRTFRALASVPNSEILKREENAKASHFPPLHSLTAYYIADTRSWKRPTRSRQYLAELGRMPGIGLVYEESKLRAPGAVAPADPYVKAQGYLNAAPEGVGANTPEVWGSFDGSGVGFVDVETGWNLNHRDFPAPLGKPQPLVNANDALGADHGTAVLGIVLAKVPANQQREGITGLAPGARFIGVSSWYDDQRPTGYEAEEAGQDRDDPYIATAIFQAAASLGRGDVLLVEVETSIGYPAEVEELSFTAMRNAAGNDVIVIEAAGNGTGTVGRNLDKPPTGRKGGPPKDRSLNRTAGSFQDSGTILVSACRSNLTSNGEHRRNGFANYGSRVDCYAWGENVATTGGYGLGPNNGPNSSYRDDFHGTSAASAIIAGVAILAQDIASGKPGGRLLPLAMRALLSDPANGTAVLGPTKKPQIGVMPDLKKISALP
jgi:hypothetical protein